MKGLQDLNMAEIQAGCAEEIAANGRYWSESHLLKSYVGMLYAYQCDGALHEGIKKIMANRQAPDILKHNARLCFANTLTAGFVDEAICGYLEIGREKYGMAKDSFDYLEKVRFDQRKIYVVKSGILVGLVHTGAYKANFSVQNQCVSDLAKCCLLMPNFEEVHMQHYMATKHHLLVNAKLKQLKEFCERFPNSVDFRCTYAILLSEHRQSETAKQEMLDLRQRAPECVNAETWRAEAITHLNEPASVDLFKQAISCKPYYGANYDDLYEYFELATHEYSKALEVLNKGLQNINDKRFFAVLFAARQKILSRIVKQNFWNKLQ